jgi:cyclomaltodextrinase
MQDKKEHACRQLAPRRQIVVDVSWDRADFGEDTPYLVGEWSDWEEPTPLCREEEGEAQRGKATLDLEEGVYAYKLRAGPAFALNGSESRTVTTDGVTNNVLSVGGAPEPVLHAPAAPFLHYPEDGGVVVRAGVRKGASRGLRLAWCERPEEVLREANLLPCGETTSHVYFQTRLPVSADRFEYVFRLDAGAPIAREDGARFAARGRDAPDLPAWWRDAVVYTIFVDRFRPETDRDDWSIDPGAGNWSRGHLAGIRRSLDELADLGVNTLYLTPIHVAASCHRYDLEDPSRVDPSLGGEALFEALLSDLHARGMRLLLDWSFSHAGVGFAPYRDVMQLGAASKFADWFQWSPAGPDGSELDAPRVRHYAGCSAAPLFDLRQRDLAAYALATAERWIRLGVDGLRIDCAAQVPLDLLIEIRQRVRAIDPQAVIVGELVPGHAWRWRETGALDASTDFEFHRLATDRFASPRGDSVDLAARWDKLVAARGPEPVHHAIRFVSTHDFPRFFSLTRAAGCDANDLLAFTWLLTMPGVPMLLYGEEIGMRAEVAEIDPEGVWRDRAPFPWNAPRSPRARQFREVLRALLRARGASDALRHGSVGAMHTDGPLWTYRRQRGIDVVDVAIHQGEESIVIELEDAELPRATPLFTYGRVHVEGQRVTLDGPSAVLLRRAPLPRVPTALSVRARDELFRNASPRAEVPRRLDVSLTERCNLKCAHCITLAPERTARGTARSLSPFLLAKLGPALRHVEHVGFVHGGEALTTPMLFDFLSALRDARGPDPAMVHLLTNGMLLTGAMTERLARAGVRSISVSVDGARAATNDAVRSGAKLATIRELLEDAVRVRRELGCDLRLGLSTVVLPTNLDELGAVVDLASTLGLDWVKFEELVPATPHARTSLLGLDDARVRAAVRAACERAQECGVLAVDHTWPMPRWVCALDESSGARHRADEFINRTDLNPCRDPWELACIEPNGDVLMGAFHGVCVGNLGERDLLDVWNSEAAATERARGRLARRCAGGEVVCLSSRG